jgi:hypothetical protein
MLVYELLDHGSVEEHVLGRGHADLQWQVGGRGRESVVEGGRGA